jgi:hypothetical protein
MIYQHILLGSRVVRECLTKVTDTDELSLMRGAGYFSLGLGAVTLWKSTRVPWSTVIPRSAQRMPGKHYFWIGICQSSNLHRNSVLMYLLDFSTIGSQLLSTVYPEEGQTDRQYLDSTCVTISHFTSVGACLDIKTL